MGLEGASKTADWGRGGFRAKTIGAPMGVSCGAVVNALFGHGRLPVATKMSPLRG